MGCNDENYICQCEPHRLLHLLILKQYLLGDLSLGRETIFLSFFHLYTVFLTVDWQSPKKRLLSKLCQPDEDQQLFCFCQSPNR